LFRLICHPVRWLVLWTCLSPVALAATPDEEAQTQAVRVSQAAIGRSVSNWRFVDRSGREVRMSDLRGKPLLVSFIYTGCFQVCPTTTRFLQQSVRAARDALGHGSFRVISIGFNQPFDSPEALSDFSRKHGINLAEWEFLAPRQADVEPMLAEFGLRVTPTTAGFDHIIQASLVDADGAIYRQIYGDAFDLQMLIEPLKQLLSGQVEGQGTLDSVWLKVKLFCTVYDPNTGRYKFNYSLFVELFAGLTFLGALAAYGIHGLRRLREQERSKHL